MGESKVKLLMMKFTRQYGLIKWLSGIEEVFGWYQNTVIDEVKFVRKSYGFLLVLKGRRKAQGKHSARKVTFVEGDSVAGCLNNLASFVRSGHIKWHDDRYPPNIGD